MTRYLLTYDVSTTSQFEKQIQAFVANNRHIYQWAFLFKGSFFLKSSASFSDLYNSFVAFFSDHQFVLARIENGAELTNGMISVDIWNWLAQENGWSGFLADLSNQNK